MKELYAMTDPMEKPRLATIQDLRDHRLVQQLIKEAEDRIREMWETSDRWANFRPGDMK